MSSLNAPFGAICRQVLPHNFGQFKRDELSRLWRWVMWDIEPISYNMGVWVRRTYQLDESRWVLVRSKRGVKGGWNDLSFTRRSNAMPGFSHQYTLYLGHVFEDDVPSTKKWPDVMYMQQVWALFPPVRAHLQLHDGVKV